MYVGRDFDPTSPSESEVYSLDFVNDLPSGDALSAATVALTVDQGTDANPTSRLVLFPAIIGTAVAQRVAGLLAGCRYCLAITATTTQGNTLTLFSRITSRAPV